jgi:hypothetical protein
MPIAHRSRWMCDYMKEYRQGKLRGRQVEGHPQPANPDRREKLKEAHRLNSRKWRLSKLLGPRYDLLFYVQYESQEWDSSKYGYPRYKSSDFPVSEWFWHCCDSRGGEIFKLFLFLRKNRGYNRLTSSVVGVLDKAALLKHLHGLTGRKRKELSDVIEKLEAAATKEEWRVLDYSGRPYYRFDGYLWLYKPGSPVGSLGHIGFRPLKWTARKHPDWRDTGLRKLLSRWMNGHRQPGMWDRSEIRGVDNRVRRGWFSPIVSEIA